MSTEGSVLDLCVRKAEKRCTSPRQGFTRYVPEPEITPTGGLDLYSRGGGGDPRIFRPIIAQDTGYSATVAVLQHRLYEEKLRSPPQESFGSEHGDSVRSESPTASPGYVRMVTQAVPTSTRSGKLTRPFKAYPNDPLSLVSSASDGLLGDSNEAFAEFRRHWLERIHEATGGNTGNKNMKRPVQSSSPTSQQPSSSVDPNKDPAYYERRRKNNEAAKRSRDARRAKEDEIAIRAAFLEQENIKLKYEVAALRNETNRLKCMLYSS